MAKVARGIGETTNAVQLNGFLGKAFYHYNLFSQIKVQLYRVKLRTELGTELGTEL